MQSYTIFNKNNKVFITKKLQNNILDSENKIIYCNSENLNSLDFSSAFQDNCTKDVIAVAQDIDTKTVFEKAVQGLYFVKAAGGIIENEHKDILFMYRNGHWDLPKGHHEAGETIEQTAKREVCEECGVKDVEQKEFLACTYHTYIMNRRREIKQTYWYRMFCHSSQSLTPQTEEGITRLEWIAPKDLDKVLKESYPNIRLLFASVNLNNN